LISALIAASSEAQWLVCSRRDIIGHPSLWMPTVPQNL
jgi:hypothetical protein